MLGVKIMGASVMDVSCKSRTGNQVREGRDFVFDRIRCSSALLKVCRVPIPLWYGPYIGTGPLTSRCAYPHPWFWSKFCYRRKALEGPVEATCRRLS
jgi:hypothetical protein